MHLGFGPFLRPWNRHFPFAFSPRCENELRTAEYSVRQSLPFWRHFPFAFHLAFYGGYGGLDSFRGCVSRQMILSCPSVVFMKCKADKSEHHQDGSSYHQPMRILHRGASLAVPHFFAFSPNSTRRLKVFRNLTVRATGKCGEARRWVVTIS